MNKERANVVNAAEEARETKRRGIRGHSVSTDDDDDGWT